MSFASIRSIRVQNPRVVTPVSAKKPTQGKALSSIVNFKTNQVIVNTTLRTFSRYKSDQKGPSKPQPQAPQKTQGGQQATQKPQVQQPQQASRAAQPQQPPAKTAPPQKNTLVTQQQAPAARQDLIVDAGPKDPVRIQGEMKQLIDQEVAALETEATDPFLSEYLRVAQFEIVPRKQEELYKLTKTMDNFKIDIAFSTEPPMPEENPEDNFDMDELKDEDADEDGAPGKRFRNEDEDEDEELGEDEEGNENPWISPISVSVKVQFLDPQTKNPKGTWELECLAGEEERLYVEQMRVHDVNGNTVSQTLFDGLSQPVQDKVYDLLDEIGVDDNLAKFVQHAVVDELRNDEVNFLRTFKGMLLS